MKKNSSPLFAAMLLFVFVGMMGPPPSLGADATATILWREDGLAIDPPSPSTFKTNIFFYVPNVGDPKTLDVVPQGGFKFKGDVTVNPTGLDTAGSAGKVSDSLATYKFKIISPSKQGKAEVTGKIERIPTGGGGGGGSPPERPFDISVLQQWERLIMGTNETDSVGLTNLIVCAGTTNQIFAKVFLGDMTTPSSGKVHWSLVPTTLGTFTANDVILTSGVAKTMFIAETNGGSGMMKADATEIKDAANNSLPNISTNMMVNIPKVDMDIIHPGTGEVAEAEEESPGGLVAVKRDNMTPLTQLKLRKIEPPALPHGKRIP